MKVRTLEELSDCLTSDLAWRKKELSLLLSAARSNKGGMAHREAMIRSAITVLYAHWEGFIKLAATSYLDFVSRRRLRYEELQDSLCLLAIRSEFRLAAGSDKFSRLMAIANFFLNRQKETSNLPVDTAISTRSNLSSIVLKELVSILSLDYDPYETKEKLIDRSLLYYRNNIAHGRELYPSLELLEELYSEIIGLMNLFKNQLENAAMTGGYRKTLSVKQSLGVRLPGH